MFVAFGTNEGDRWIWHDPNHRPKVGPVHISEGKSLTLGKVDCLGHLMHCGRALPDIVADVTIGDHHVGIRQCDADEWIVVGFPYNETLAPL
jgi:hypothetical protein